MDGTKILAELKGLATAAAFLRAYDIEATVLCTPAGPVEIGWLAPPRGQKADGPPRAESRGMVIVRWAAIVVFLAVAGQAASSWPLAASGRQDTPPQRAAALTDGTQTKPDALAEQPARQDVNPPAPAGFGWG